MHELEQDVDRAIRERKLVRRGQPMLVAVSGGLDSMVLLHVLRALAAENSWQVTVAHFNHRLRGRHSDLDEQFVRRAASKLSLPFVSARGEVKALSLQSGDSIEVAARRLRHEFLAREAARLGIRTVALAHHADDQVELFFVRLLRGAGNEGLGGMKWINASPANRSIRLIRPLLDQPRERLAAYASAKRIRYREDETNAMRFFLRNRIRHELLPLLRKNYQPALDRVVGRLMRLAEAESELAIEIARAWLRDRAPQRFEKLHLAVQRRCIQLQLHEKGILSDFALVEHLRQRVGDRVMIDPQRVVWRDEHGFVHCDVSAPGTDGGFSTERSHAVKFESASGRAEFAGKQFKWRLMAKRSARLPAKRVRQERFDAEKIGLGVILRFWRAGDRFQPIGFRAPCKLQDLFTNLKVPRDERHRRVVATTLGGEIFWVEGLRIGETFKVTESTARVLLWRWNAAKSRRCG